MARLIDADEFERFLMNLPDEVLCEDCCYVVVNEMRKQPTIEAETVKHGKWIEDTVGCENPFDPYKEDYMDVIICSKCGTYYGIEAKDNFCSKCGARMDGE